MIHALLERLQGSTRLVTTTTRSPRSGEREGFDYHFMSDFEFEKKIQRGDFVEYVRYANCYYGTDRRILEDTLSAHTYVFAALDTRGKRSLKDLGISFFSIFLLPESMAVLRERLGQRPEMSQKDIDERLKEAEREIKEAQDYDVHITNRQGYFDKTIQDIIDSLPR